MQPTYPVHPGFGYLESAAYPVSDQGDYEQVVRRVEKATAMGRLLLERMFNYSPHRIKEGGLTMYSCKPLCFRNHGRKINAILFCFYFAGSVLEWL